jgi:hypothetical protein
MPLTLPDEIDELIIDVEMIKEISIQTEISIISAIKVLAFYYNIDYRKLRKDIKELMPEWFNYDPIVGYLDGKPIKRSNCSYIYNNTIRKINKNMRKRIKDLNHNDTVKISNHLLTKLKPTMYDIFKRSMNE